MKFDRTLSAVAAMVLGSWLAGPSPTYAESVSYKLDPDHVSVGFLVNHIGYAKVLGLFREASGSFLFDEQTGELSDLEVVIETDSVFTNHKKRDQHLRSADFLNSREFSTMTFRAKSTRPTSDRSYAIDGELFLLGRTGKLVLQATWNKSGKYPIDGKPYVMGVSVRGSFRRSDYGMTYAVDNGWVGDEIELIIELEARRQ